MKCAAALQRWDVVLEVQFGAGFTDGLDPAGMAMTACIEHLACHVDRQPGCRVLHRRIPAGPQGRERAQQVQHAPGQAGKTSVIPPGFAMAQLLQETCQVGGIEGRQQQQRQGQGPAPPPPVAALVFGGNAEAETSTKSTADQG